MTNIDFDHPDYYQSIDDVFSFSIDGQASQKGIFAFGDDAYLRKLEADVPIYYYGVNDDDDVQAKTFSVQRQVLSSMSISITKTSVISCYRHLANIISTTL